MDNQIKVDTTMLEDYKSTIQNVINSLDKIDSNLLFHARLHNYYNLQGFLGQYTNSAPLGYYKWALGANRDYLQAVIDSTTYVETLMTKIDPLNYDDTVFDAELATDSFRHALLDISESFDKIGDVADTFIKSLGKKNDVIKTSLNKIGDYIGVGEYATNGWVKATKVVGGVADAIGVITTVADNFISNESNSRAIAESITECAIDLAVGAAVTAVMGVFTFPVSLAIGAAAFIGGAALDCASEAITDKKVTELVSDSILDCAADWFDWDW